MCSTGRITEICQGGVESGLPWSAKQTMDIIVEFLKGAIGGV
jgi:hypothetical protein